ncbi:hypothetical protein C8R43DRAFT_144266 [Mycena crocata]|nr:hypothetical protein C8R43DRAFT_144266 [Mycena crocata]
MDAGIGEPFHLASYGVAQRPRKLKSKGTSKAQHPVANLYATHEKIASGSSDGYVTVTAQGDGVHVLDVSTLHPVISHTLGPSTSFSCPSVSLSIPHGQENSCATYSAIASSANVALEDCGRTIWVWHENLSSTSGDRASQKKKAAVMPHYVSEMYPLHGSPQRLLVLSPAGNLTIIDADLNIRNTLPSPASDVVILQSFVFRRESCSFLSVSSGSTALVLLEHSQEAATSLRIVDIGGDDEVREIGSCKIPLESDIAAVSCSSSGYLSVLTRDGSWYSFQIESQNEGISVYSAAQPLRLKSLSFIGKTATSLSGEVSVVALNTSLVLLAAVTSSARSIALLLWDLQYSVLLASHSVTIPATLSHLPKLSITLQLMAASSPQVLLVLSPPISETQDNAATRSSILVVPLTVPEMSTIGNAMGRAPAGAQWLVQPSASDSLGPARSKVLAAVQNALSNDEPEVAKTAFFDWELSERPSGEVVDGGERQVVLGHSFVRDLLAAVLRPRQASYSPEIVKFLLERGVVSAGMVEGGLLAALKLRDDWNAIQLGIDHVIDLPESDLMSILQFVAQRSRNADEADAMDVDAPALGAIPTLPTFLNACVQYQTSAANLRAAIHQNLAQPEDVVAVLEVLDEWVGQWKGAEVIALPPKKSVRKDEHGVTVLKDGWQKDDAHGAYPPLIKVLSFIQIVLDASFLALLQHTPAHGVLRKVLARIEPEIQLTEHVELLRGPLELFARAQSKAVRDGKEGKKDGGDWRQRRRLAHERYAMAVGGVYQLEELVL